MEQFGIKEALKILGVKSSNPGVSSGTAWIKSKGSYIASYSPADGKLIGKVKAADEASFNKVVLQAKPFRNGDLCPPLNEEKWYDKLEQPYERIKNHLGN